MNVITNDSKRCEKSLSALKKVKDPEIGLNIVDLGLIYQIDFDDDNSRIFLQMTLTTQFCPMGQSIIDQVRDVVQDAFPHEAIEVTLTFDPGWSAQRISDAGRLFLNK